MSEAIEATRYFLETLNLIEKDWVSWQDELLICEQEIQDLLHEIELTKFDAARGYQLAKQIQEVRQRRRQLKDYMEITKHLKEYLDVNKQMKITLFKVLTAMEKTEENQGHRIYTPRVRMDITLAEGLEK